MLYSWMPDLIFRFPLAARRRSENHWNVELHAPRLPALQRIVETEGEGESRANPGLFAELEVQAGSDGHRRRIAQRVGRVRLDGSWRRQPALVAQLDRAGELRKNEVAHVQAGGEVRARRIRVDARARGVHRVLAAHA